MTHPIVKEMRSLMLKLLIVSIFMIMSSTFTQTPMNTYAQFEVPAYAKWGALAMKETHFKYPNANIIDYLYEGSEFKEKTTIAKFKLWLKEADKEFGVLVRIEFTTESEEVVHIEFQETTQ